MGIHRLRLGVNVDHIATVRQARRGRVPDPVAAARVCEEAGAGGIVCHLREDRRHIQDEDVRRLRSAVRTRLNLEMSIAPDIVAMALDVKPDHVTLVPERREELTTEGGLDAIALCVQLRGLVERFHAKGIEVSLFVDPAKAQLDASRATGARIVELHTGRYADATSPGQRQRELSALREAASYGREAGLAVAAGHGLDYDNVGPVAALETIEELNIGFSIITRALSVGLKQAVEEMLYAMWSAEKAGARR